MKKFLTISDSTLRILKQHEEMAMGAGGGALVGGLVGAMVDGLIPGRQRLFERTEIRFVPLLSPRTRAIGITVGWR